MIEEKYKAIADYCQNGIPAIKRTGLVITDMRERYAKILMPIEGNTNHIGIMYADGSPYPANEIFSGRTVAPFTRLVLPRKLATNGVAGRS